MIFNVPGHIDMIRNGLYHLPADMLNNPIENRQIKTQTRRVSRGIYQVGRDYAVQRKQGVKAETDIRIVMERIWIERSWVFLEEGEAIITHLDAWEEGFYSPEEFEKVFWKAYPRWDGKKRWAFRFHVIEVLK